MSSGARSKKYAFIEVDATRIKQKRCNGYSGLQRGRIEASIF